MSSTCRGVFCTYRTKFKWLLRDVITHLRWMCMVLEEELDTIQQKRNYMQLERDQVATFYDITKRDTKKLDLEIDEKDREMEIMEENHDVEERVYVQKVRHLEYQHKINMKRVKSEAKKRHSELEGQHKSRMEDVSFGKTQFQRKTKEQLETNAQEIQSLKEHNKLALEKLSEQFQEVMNKNEKEFEDRIDELKKDLELQRKVEVHEIEERKNLHINDLVRNHELAFKQIRDYYNAITRDNLKLIKDLKHEVVTMKEKAESTHKNMIEMSHQNKHLKAPLEEAQRRVRLLKDSLKDRSALTLTLRNVKGRVRSLDRELQSKRETFQSQSSKFEKTRKDRDNLCATFMDTVSSVQRQTELKNLVIRKKLSVAESDMEQRRQDLSEIASAANLDPFAMEHALKKLDHVLELKNEKIDSLKYNVAKVAKMHDDACRTLEQKLRDFGITADDSHLLLCTATSAPAQLLTK